MYHYEIVEAPPEGCNVLIGCRVCELCASILQLQNSVNQGYVMPGDNVRQQVLALMRVILYLLQAELENELEHRPQDGP